MAKRRKKPEPTTTPVYVFDIDSQGEPIVKELNVVREPEANQTRFTLFSGDLTRVIKKLRARDQPPPNPGA